MSVTEKATPAPAAAGAENAETWRSGPTWIGRLSRLFSSLLSTTASAPSAMATTKYVPGTVPAGIVTLVVPGLLAPGASTGTLRLPSRTSAGSTAESVER